MSSEASRLAIGEYTSFPESKLLTDHADRFVEGMRHSLFLLHSAGNPNLTLLGSWSLSWLRTLDEVYEKFRQYRSLVDPHEMDPQSSEEQIRAGIDKIGSYWVEAWPTQGYGQSMNLRCPANYMARIMTVGHAPLDLGCDGDPGFFLEKQLQNNVITQVDADFVKDFLNFLAETVIPAGKIYAPAYCEAEQAYREAFTRLVRAERSGLLRKYSEKCRKKESWRDALRLKGKILDFSMRIFFGTSGEEVFFEKMDPALTYDGARVAVAARMNAMRASQSAHDLDTTGSTISGGQLLLPHLLRFRSNEVLSGTQFFGQ